MAASGSLKAKILATDSRALFQRAIIEVAALLRAGEVVALPTETVYGLAANAFDAEAVAKLYAIKDRPGHNPIIVHVVGIAMARRCVKIWPPLAERLAAAFWPGPLTLVLPKAEEVPASVTAGLKTVGVRWPRHPFIQEVIQACGFPLAAPSANRSGEISPTTSEHVQKSLGDRIPLIVDGGPSQVGIESTVADLTLDPPAILRPGMIHAETILAVAGTLTIGASGSRSQILRSPGLLPRHYAPKTQLVVWAWADAAQLRQKLSGLGIDPKQVFIIAHTVLPPPSEYAGVLVIPHDPEAYARAIYAELHRCDEQRPALIVLEALPETPEWEALNDRMDRASHLE